MQYSLSCTVGHEEPKPCAQVAIIGPSCASCLVEALLESKAALTTQWQEFPFAPRMSKHTDLQLLTGCLEALGDLWTVCTHTHDLNGVPPSDKCRAFVLEVVLARLGRVQCSIAACFGKGWRKLQDGLFAFRRPYTS